LKKVQDMDSKVNLVIRIAVGTQLA
jgi:hypothetical protein